MEGLEIPQKFTGHDGFPIDGTEGFCIFLERFAYPCRYLDTIPRFARPVPQLFMASNVVLDYL